MAVAVVGTNTNFQAAYVYAAVVWGALLIRAIVHQLSRVQTFLRRQRYFHQGSTRHGKRKRSAFASVFARSLNALEYSPNIPMHTFTIRSATLMVIIVALNIVAMLFAPFSYAWSPYTLPTFATVTKRCAFLATTNFSLIIAFATRNSIFVKLIGVPFERMLPYHRNLAKIAAVEGILHAAYEIAHEYADSFSVRDALFGDVEYGSGAVTVLCMVVIYCTSFELVRRKYFELFYVCHIVGFLAMVVAGSLHELWVIAFFAPSLALWVGDRMMRFYKSHFGRTRVVSVSKATDNVLKIDFSMPGLANAYKPGQYVFVNVKDETSLHWTRWHPFTISMIESRPGSLLDKHKQKMDTGSESMYPHMPEDTYMVASIYIKSIGDTTTTFHRLLATAVLQDVKIKIDGPLGMPTVDFQDYSTVILMACGIGITPGISILQNLVERKLSGNRAVLTDTIHLVWVIRKQTDCELFWNTLEKTADQLTQARHVHPLTLHLDCYVTQSSDYTNLLEKTVRHANFTLHHGRPDIPQLIHKLKETYVDEDIGLHTCGPRTFMRQVRNHAVMMKGSKGVWEVSDETFEF
ncbi:hypothetical protein BZG36_03005 [Bifiguratus adelaidae]|uniref:FAD-binding FR-type domain-containing protein n=1 Tax=Bifiguratus adelaidae TaxID=1938954 RepID=A0A261XZM7_9FUNG|nr:hypothetical protein BZG36_03005 [Bifiguratus adelaidae]